MSDGLFDVGELQVESAPEADVRRATGMSIDPTIVLSAQPRAQRTIERLLAAGRAHALLLSGTPGSGTRAAAEWIAQSLLCPAGGGDGCATCGRVQRRVHPDLAWIEPEGADLAIDQMRAVSETVTRMPFEARAQVVVLEAADSLSSDNAAAGNSLLKALEEPAGRVVFVLLAERSARLLPTIRSRVIEVAFPPIPDVALAAALEAAGIDAATAGATSGMDLTGIARASRGNLDVALELATGGAAAQRRGDVLPVLEAVVAGNVPPAELAARVLDRANSAGEVATVEATEEFERMLERMGEAEQRSFRAKSNDQGMEKRTARRARRARGVELQLSLRELAGWWRDVAALHAGAPEAVAAMDRVERLRAAAAGPAGARAVAAIDAIDEAAARLRINNADEPVTVGALASELAALARGRMRARRGLGAPARTPAGYDLSLG